MAATLPNQVPVALAEPLWQKVVSDFRCVCVLRREAREDEARRVFETELPASILAWAESDHADGAAQAQRLQEMFPSEAQRVHDAWLAQEWLAHRLQHLRGELLNSLTAQVGAEVRRAVRELPVPTRTAEAPAAPTSAALLASHRPRARAMDLASVIDLVLSEQARSPQSTPLSR